MSEIAYTLEQFISDIQGLGTDVVYPYASLSGSSSSSCRLVSINAVTGAIQYSRNGSTRSENISSQMVQKLVSALGTRQAVEVNSLYGGSGNFRSALEALVVHTPHVFLCKIGGKKHIYWDPEHSHSSGTIELVENPSVALLGAVAESPQRAKDELGLIVGMRSPDSSYGVVTILDDDDYCYQVLCVNESKHSSGIRTISKLLLKEWIVAVKAAPDKGAEAIRDDLTGKTDIDKFEYGNAGVLIKLAKMATGQSDHSLVDVSSFWHRRMGRSERMNLPVEDLLSNALKIFAEKRYEQEWQEKTRKDDYQSIYDMPNLAPEQLATGSLDEFYNNFLLKIWAFKNGGSRRFGQLDNAGKAKYRAFIVDMKKEQKGFDAYFPPDTQCPDGMGVGVLTELLMRFWPKSCCSYNESLIHDALVTLGMAEGDFVWPKTPSIYQDFMGKCTTILRKMEQMKLPRRPEPGNDEPPDYFTVNEFLWFVHDYKDLIQEEVMKKQWKPINSKEKIKKGMRKLSEAFANDEMLKRLGAVLRTKPFAILAGHSGTGKSQLVRRLAYMTCNNELLVKEGEGKTAPGNFCMVQVKPNWHDSTDLLGYYSEMGGRHFVNTPFVEFICKAYAYPDTPFFVCLDEMNLAPVEQYFAEYLSAIESMEKKDGEWVTDPLVEVDKTGEKDSDGKEKVNAEIVDQIMQGAASTEAAAWIQAHGLTIPKNLFVVGTVNMDETTCQFSRKVLDRAMTLLMTEAKFADMANSKKPSEEELLDDEGLKFFLEGEVRGTVGEIESKHLDGINEPLANTAFVVAYRFANEYALYEAACAKLNGFDLDAASNENREKLAVTALDHVVLMKLLPRIHGEARVVKGLFNGRKMDGKDVPGLKSKLPSDGLSVTMMDKILAREEEYLTFWP